jgi:hypothetical protein
LWIAVLLLSAALTRIVQLVRRPGSETAAPDSHG